MKLFGKAKAEFLKRMAKGRAMARSSATKSRERVARLQKVLGPPIRARSKGTYASHEIGLVGRNPRNKRKGKGKRRNSSEEQQAAEIYEQFHGTPSTKTTVYEIADEHPEHLAKLGKLLNFLVYVNDEETLTVIENFGQCELTCTPDGGQLHLVNGNQVLTIDALGLGDQLPKGLVEVGAVAQITYHTRKGFHDFEPTDYWHNFGEERGGKLPRLHYDTRNARLFLSGGTYQVRPEGIVN